MEIFKDFTFEAAHRLPHVPEGHKCFRLHGHSFRIRVSVDGEDGAESGWVMDFANITEAVKPVRMMLDHQYLNEVEGLSNPTSENLAIWLWERLARRLPGLSQIIVQETCTSGCVYRGPNEARRAADNSGKGAL